MRAFDSRTIVGRLALATCLMMASPLGLNRLGEAAGVGFMGQARAQETPLARTTLQAGMHLIRAEIAADPASRSRGLMFRERLGPNEGMLFVFEQPSTQCFWMRNTLIPLTIAFLAEDGRIVNTADMEPKSEASHCSNEAVRFALEMERGWFAKRGLNKGDRLSAPTFFRTP